MTVVSKAILKAFYGKAQHHAYFVGCSTGGQQALMEAQRYPSDYNGIIAGAPANNRTHLHTDFLWNYKITNKNKKALFSNEELSFITRKIITAYAGKDGGAPSDNFLTDPGMINVDFEKLFKCQDGNDSCLSDEKIAALKEIYTGPVNPRTHEQVYTPPPVGSENTPGGLLLQQTPQGIDGLFYQFKWVFGRDFDYTRFDFDKDQDRMDSMLTPLLNANNPDLDAMKKSGGKLIMFTGTADPLVPYQDAVNYYERVINKQRGLRQTQTFFRYFLIPGMGHCGAGPGLNDVNENILSALIDWVEHNNAPDKIIATALNCCQVNGPIRFKRPIFPYPQFPHYIGGDVNDVSSYKAVEHPRNRVQVPAEKYLK